MIAGTFTAGILDTLTTATITGPAPPPRAPRLETLDRGAQGHHHGATDAVVAILARRFGAIPSRRWRVLHLEVLHHRAARLEDGIAVDQPADEQVAVRGDAPAQLLDVL